MFERMKDLAKNSIETARKALTAKKADAESAEQVLAAEIAILERHASFVERLDRGRTDFETISEALKERYTRDAIPQFAAQLAADTTRLDWLAGELAKSEVVRANLARIQAEFEKYTIHSLQADLKAFEAEHRAVLRKHNAVN
jgi:hypothetical protein